MGTRMVPTVDGRAAEAGSRVLRVSQCVADLLVASSHPDAHAIGVWSLLDTARHLALGAEFFSAVARGEAVQLHDLRDNAGVTVAAVAAEPETDLPALAARMMRGDEGLVGAAQLRGDGVEVFCGVVVSPMVLMALELGELLVHGRDIARASGQQWTIDPDDARLAVTSTTALLPHLIDPVAAGSMHVTCEVRVTGGHRSAIRVDHGVAAEVPAGSVEPDAILSADPVALLLLSFGRVPVVRCVLSGRVRPHGRRPWAIARLLGAVTAV